MNYDPLIFGKDSTENITSIEAEDDILHIFREVNGEEYYSAHPNKFWIVSNSPLNNGFTRLKGDLHYKYGTTFTDRKDFQKWRRIWKRDKDIFSIYNSTEANMVRSGITYFKGMKPSDVSILSFDIESTSLKHGPEAKVLLISNTYRSQGDVIRKLFCYDEYKTQGDMIDAWCTYVREMNPSIILGHNIVSYDLPYLKYIAEQNNTDLYLGRDSTVPIQLEDYESKFRVDGTRDLHYHKVKIWGREVIDTMFLAYKYDATVRKYVSYGLKNIIKQEELEKENRQFYDASKIRENYSIPEEWIKIKDYCIHDSDDSLALYDLMAPAFFFMTQSIPKTWQSVTESATGSQINAMMIRSYLQEGHSIPKASEVFPFEGAISHGIPGIHNNVLSFDVASLYPSIILEFKIYDKEKDPNKNFLYIVNKLTEERLNNKKLFKETGIKYYDDLQSSEKIAINSAYGFFSATGLLFNSPNCAALVTLKGREILKKAIHWATNKSYEVWKEENIIE